MSRALSPVLWQPGSPRRWSCLDDATETYPPRESSKVEKMGSTSLPLEMPNLILLVSGFTPDQSIWASWYSGVQSPPVPVRPQCWLAAMASPRWPLNAVFSMMNAPRPPGPAIAATPTSGEPRIPLISESSHEEIHSKVESLM